MRCQRTISRIVSCSGIGLHSGKPVKLVLVPAPVDTGLIFRRHDLPGQPALKADWRHVVDTRFATTLRLGDCSVATVEHLLAAAYGLGIDNLIVEMDGGEVPIMDGSAARFVGMLKEAGIQDQEKPIVCLALHRPVRISDGDREATLEPADDLQLSVVIDFDHPRIGRQSFSLIVSESTFEKELSRARTFGFLSDVESMKANGLAKGGSLGNAVVLGEEEVINSDGLRYPDEFVRHKTLDCLGDLSLFGMPVMAHYSGYKPGHSLNLRILRQVFDDPRNYCLVDGNYRQGRRRDVASSTGAVACLP